MIKDIISPGTTLTIIAQQETRPERLDKFITAHLSQYSRTFFQELITQGHVKVNDKVIKKSNLEIKFNDKIDIFFPIPAIPEGLPVDKDLCVKVIYEHKQFLIVYKPANLMVHAPTSYSTTVTLSDWLIKHFKELKEVGPHERPGIVHRLDKETSGILIIPRNNQAHMLFSNMFKERLISKTYLAVAWGHPPDSGSIDFKISRNPVLKHKMTHHKIEGRESLTYYNVKEYLSDSALVEVHPVTGRTHQIRVHFAAIGHPIIGDKVYGKPSKLIDRQALHAYKLSFCFENSYYSFICDMPEDMKLLVNNLRDKKDQ